MNPTPDQNATELLANLSGGDRSAAQRLWPLIYDELRVLAASHMKRENAGHTLQPTALVNEAYLRLVDQTRVQWQNRAHFFAVAAEVIRRVLVDHARAKHALKRGGDAVRVTMLDPKGDSGDDGTDLLDLDRALKELATLNERQARVVELKFFAGLEVPEIAETLGVSERTVKYEWRFARAWLHKQLSGTDGP